MKIVFIGTVEFSKKALQKLIEFNAQVVGVCTKEKSDFNSDFADLTPLCKGKKYLVNLQTISIQQIMLRGLNL